jgi:hypothetical protein
VHFPPRPCPAQQIDEAHQSNTPFWNQELYVGYAANDLSCGRNPAFCLGRLDEYPINDLLNSGLHRLILRPLEDRKIGVPVRESEQGQLEPDVSGSSCSFLPPCPTSMAWEFLSSLNYQIRMRDHAK